MGLRSVVEMVGKIRDNWGSVMWSDCCGMVEMLING